MMNSYRNKLAETAAPFIELLNPPNRVEPYQYVCDNMYVSNPGGYSGLYDGQLTPYMKEPLNCMVERQYKSVIFVGPAQAGKSVTLLNGFLFYQMLNDSHDAMMITNSMERASDWSKRSFDRMVTANPQLREIVLGGKESSMSRKMLKNGVMLTITHGTPNTLAGRSFRTILITDIDRTTSTGEGDIYQLGMARTRTFGSQAMVLAESSPSFEVSHENADWEPKTPHDAPPVDGVLGLYSSGDKRIIYWPCGHCGDWFNPPATLDGLFIPEGGSDADRIAGCGVVCPSCGSVNTDDHRHDMIASCKWVAEGQEIDCTTGEVTGELPDKDTASFWLPGVVAAFTNFKGLAKNFIKANNLFEATGNEESLKVFVNTDLGGVYSYKSMQNDKDPSVYQLRAEELDKGEVPEEAQCLIAAIDVQKGRFVCQIMAYGEHGECWLVDRFNLRHSTRLDENGESYPINPASFAEDWDVLLDRVIESEYETTAGATFKPVLTLCDSGGEPGVTPNAYNFYRKMKRLGKSGKFQLVKGASNSMRDNFKITRPDERNTGTKSSAKGDIPLAMLNTNSLKDIVYGKLSREEVGPGFMHFPAWVKDWFYSELVSEVRVNGKYEKKSKRANNEALDLYAYAEAGLLIKGYDKINWEGVKPYWLGPEKKQVTRVVRPRENRVRATFDPGI